MELYKATRLLLRHSISARHGAGVPEVELMAQMQKLDKIMDHDWQDASKHYSGYPRREPNNSRRKKR